MRRGKASEVVTQVAADTGAAGGAIRMASVTQLAMPSLPSVLYQQPQSRMILETPLAHECSGIKLSAVVCICSIEAEGDQSFPSGG